LWPEGWRINIRSDIMSLCRGGVPVRGPLTLTLSSERGGERVEATHSAARRLDVLASPDSFPPWNHGLSRFCARIPSPG
jgi:hypothetical protein